MGDLLDATWPVKPIATERLIIRPAGAGDRPGCVELLCSPSVRRYLGGPKERREVESEMPEVPMAYPGHFAVEEDGLFLGTVTVDRRPRSRPGHLTSGGHELEVSYTFLPDAWGRGYAAESVGSVLLWVADLFPGEPVVLCTQLANVASVRLGERLSFEKIELFEEFEAGKGSVSDGRDERIRVARLAPSGQDRHRAQ